MKMYNSEIIEKFQQLEHMINKIIVTRCTSMPTQNVGKVVIYDGDIYFWNGTEYEQINGFVTQEELEEALSSLESGDSVVTVANYSALPTPSISNAGKFYWVENSQGTSWLPGSLGGTYYKKGMYYSDGVTWETAPVPYQATQLEVNTGTNNDKFITPETLEGTTKFVRVTGNQQIDDVKTFSGNTVINGNLGLSVSSPTAKVEIQAPTLTGSQDTRGIDLKQTWNTTGSPTLIFGNVTNTASGGNALLTDLQVGGVSQFNISKAGRVASAFGFWGPYFGNSAATATYISFTGHQFNLVVNGVTKSQLSSTGLAISTGGTSSKQASSLLELQSTTQGFLPPKMTGTQAEAISSPAEGLIIYSTDGSGVTITSEGWWGFSESTWHKLNAAASGATLPYEELVVASSDGGSTWITLSNTIGISFSVTYPGMSEHFVTFTSPITADFRRVHAYITGAAGFAQEYLADTSTFSSLNFPDTFTTYKTIVIKVYNP